MNRRSGEDSKRIILDAALKVFSEYGYEGANMRMIAKKAHISVGGLYLYFKKIQGISAPKLCSNIEY